MNGPDDDEDGYPVGFGKPPKHTRFTKGRSGNPSGRPRKKPSGLSWDALAPNDMFLSVAGRTVTGKIGSNPFTTTALDAVMLKVFERAAAGNVQAARMVVKMATESEARETKAKATVFWEAVLLKVQLDQKLDCWRAAGRDENDLRWHPGDIDLDWQTYEVRFYLRLTQEQRDAHAELLRCLEECEAAIVCYLATAATDCDDAILQLLRSLARTEMEAINALLPPRLRRSPPGETAVDRAKAALESPSEATREAFQRWYRRMQPHFRAWFKLGDPPEPKNPRECLPAPKPSS